MIFEILELFKSYGCVIKRKYNIYCPGCGCTRSLEALLELNVFQSIKCNPIIVLLVIDFVMSGILRVMEFKSNQNMRYNKIRMIYNISVLGIWMGFFVIRNYLLIYKQIDLLGDF